MRLVRCECGGTVYGVRQHGLTFSWCDTCTPVQVVKMPPS